MRAAIRELMSLDVDDLERWEPPSDGWALGLRVIAGPDDGPGEEVFDVTVCSVGWVAEQIRRTEVFDGRHHLVVQQFDWNVIRTYIERRVVAWEGAEWRDVAEQLAQVGHWEFHDHHS